MSDWQEAVEAQAHLLAFLTSKKGVDLLAKWITGVVMNRPHEAEVVIESGKRLPSIIRQVEPVYVSPEMTRLVQAAGDALPQEVLHQEDGPIIQKAFAYFAEPVSVYDIDGNRCTFRLVTWYPAVDPDGETGMAVTLFTYVGDRDDNSLSDEEMSRIMSGGMLYAPLHFGGFVYGDPAMATVEGADWVKHVRALWRLMEQRVATVEKRTAGRATRRRLARLAPELVPDVHVVTLRRTQERHDGGEARSVEWSHRWIVGGHWRDHWFPKQERHKKMWIAPYVKGPDDKPLELPPDKVYRLVR